MVLGSSARIDELNYTIFHMGMGIHPRADSQFQEASDLPHT